MGESARPNLRLPDPSAPKRLGADGSGNLKFVRNCQEPIVTINRWQLVSQGVILLPILNVQFVVLVWRCADRAQFWRARAFVVHVCGILCTSRWVRGTTKSINRSIYLSIYDAGCVGHEFSTPPSKGARTLASPPRFSHTLTLRTRFI